MFPRAGTTHREMDRRLDESCGMLDSEAQAVGDITSAPKDLKTH